MKQCMEAIPVDRGDQGPATRLCRESAVEGLDHCLEHATERMTRVRDFERESLARVKVRALRKVELDLEVAQLTQEDQRERVSILSFRAELDRYASAGVLPAERLP